jgi:hypothetical protein
MAQAADRGDRLGDERVSAHDPMRAALRLDACGEADATIITTSRYNPSLDGSRVLALLMVVLTDTLGGRLLANRLPNGVMLGLGHRVDKITAIRLPADPAVQP